MDTSATGDSSSTQYESQWEETKCYCGKSRSMADVEFQCAMCSRFYHMECLTVDTGPCMPFMTAYQFFCKRCQSDGTDSFVKKQANFTQMCHTAIANLAFKQPGRKYFSKDKDIIPFIEKHWDSLTTAPRRVKQTWHTTIAKTLMKDFDIFTCDEENGTNQSFGLVMNDLAQIGPNCEALFKLVSGLTAQSTSFKASAKATTSDTTISKAGRGAKRKAVNDDSKPVIGGRPKKGDVALSAKITPTGFPPEHPYNKDGYRYILAEPDPHAPNWEEFDQSMEWAGKPIPGYLYRRWLERGVMLSLNDRAPQLKVSDDRLSVTGEKGYSMIRTTHGVTVGTWYYEVTIAEMPADSGTRIGFSQSLGNLQAPCGYDKFSYCWRALQGTSFHQSKGTHFADEGYKKGDVLGFIIQLPYPSNFADLTPPVYKDKPLVKFKSHLYYEEKDHVTEAEKKLKPSPGSKIMTYKNGKLQGVLAKDIYEGTYFPAISLFKNSKVRINVGPDFKHSPKELKFRPISDAADDRVIRHAIGDILYHIEKEGQLPEF